MIVIYLCSLPQERVGLVTWIKELLLKQLNHNTPSGQENAAPFEYKFSVFLRFAG